MKSKVNVLVVDDSLFIRSFLSKILASDPSIGNIKTAVDGAAALSILSTYKPDIITLDVEMPRMNGLEALEVINKRYDIPVIMVSALTRKGANITIKCLELGAVDWIQKPDNRFDMNNYDSLKQELLQKIKLVVKIPVVTAIERSKIATNHVLRDVDNISSEQFREMVQNSGWAPKGRVDLDFKLIGIGISTGGPSALNQIVPFLPKELNAAVIIVQHMPATFTKVLAERLNDTSKINVKEAEDGDVIKRGWVYVVPGDKHIRLREVGTREIRVVFDDYPKVGGFKPSAETLFYFVGEVARAKSIGIIMTGMGSDGSDNLGRIKAYSGKTIAQDEESCIVFGMPKAAIKKGNADIVLPLNKIVAKINELVIQ